MTLGPNDECCYTEYRYWFHYAQRHYDVCRFAERRGAHLVASI